MDGIGDSLRVWEVNFVMFLGDWSVWGVESVIQRLSWHVGGVHGVATSACLCPRTYAPSILGRCYKVEQRHKRLIVLLCLFFVI